MRDFFKTDRHYFNRFRNVWLWQDWPDRDGPDTGIDIVAKEYDGTMCAIQCKCYDENGNISKKQIDSFLSDAHSRRFDSRVLVYTGGSMTGNVEKTLQRDGCSIITPEHLRSSTVDWGDYPKLIQKSPKKLRAYQEAAATDCIEGLEKNNRGKLIMACGTGKTLVSLRIAEKVAGLGKTVLYVVPSISLILQSMREWSANAEIRQYYLAVCSDKSAGGEEGSIVELESPVSTKTNTLKGWYEKRPKGAMTVVFSTYNSVEVAAKAIGRFDLVLCDEAHRTTGIEGKSFYTLVHDDDIVNAKKRLYMTATPKVYSESIRLVAKNREKVVYSMDDEERYGPDFHKLGFTDAVHRHDALADFKVKIAIVSADLVDAEFQQSLVDDDNSLPLDERTLLAAVWHGMQYPDDNTRPRLLQKVISFANRIDRSKYFAGVEKDPKGADRSFARIVSEYNAIHPSNNRVEVKHVDGKDNALKRRKEMHWLDESDTDTKTCRILSNARCLSEGVDVPALDGVVFLNPRKSVVDVVQSVGRVMRRSPSKEFGYVVLPVAIPAGVDISAAMDNNNTFKVVWQVLNALRSHDEEFAQEINTLILDRKTENTGNPTPRISVSILDQPKTEAPITKLFDKIKSKLVEKVGDIAYYDKYGRRLGEAARTIEARINTKIESSPQTRKEFNMFHESLKTAINDSVTHGDAVSVVAQHMVMAKVFDVLFTGKFASHNPVSEAMSEMAEKMGLSEELEGLEDFYKDVECELSQIDTRAARQNFIKKIYDNFFQSADKKSATRHGIVYTPVEMIDFIINSVQHVLEREFDTTFDDPGVKVLDPFTGTGTFVARLLESGHISPASMYKKYRNDIYANELMLPAYYVAAANIETTYQSLQHDRYVPFDGISYTDTLLLNPRYLHNERHRKQDTTLEGDPFEKTHKRVARQKNEKICVIICNPPYSGGQRSANEDNKNISHSELEARIKSTYIRRAPRGNTRSLYNSYIKALRWASDRIGDSGIIGFVTPSSWISGNAEAGVRACLQEEFTDIWCFDLRGQKGISQDGRNIFEYKGSSEGGTTQGVAVTILVKNPNKSGNRVHYTQLDASDYSGEQKRNRIKRFGSIVGISNWKAIPDNPHHDWVNQRDKADEEFKNHTPMGIKDTKRSKTNNAMFSLFSNGLKTRRDDWVYNTSTKELKRNMRTTIEYCNTQDPDNFIIDPMQVAWSPHVSRAMKKLQKPIKLDTSHIRTVLYRPFFKQQLYFDPVFVSDKALIPSSLFPSGDTKNPTIIVPDKIKGNFSTFITDVTPDLHILETSQCFPLYAYDKADGRHDNITEQAAKAFRRHYNDSTITRSDVFYYTYGLLHHQGYRDKYQASLVRGLPHIPMVPDFGAFRKAGRRLAKLHLGYEDGPRHNLGKPLNPIPDSPKSIKFGKKPNAGAGPQSVPDFSTIYVDGIKAYDNLPDVRYAVNGRTPVQWFADRYAFRTHKESGITNYPLDGVKGEDVQAIIERLVHVGVKSDEIIRNLPKEFKSADWKPKKTGLDLHMDVGGTSQSML